MEGKGMVVFGALGFCCFLLAVIIWTLRDGKDYSRLAGGVDAVNVNLSNFRTELKSLSERQGSLSEEVIKLKAELYEEMSKVGLHSQEALLKQSRKLEHTEHLTHQAMTNVGKLEAHFREFEVAQKEPVKVKLQVEPLKIDLILTSKSAARPAAPSPVTLKQRGKDGRWYPKLEKQEAPKPRKRK